MTAILGYSGFVGSHILQHLPNADLYNSQNLSFLKGKEYNLVYCACVPSVKWYANKHPDEDELTINTIKTHLKSIQKCNKFILISTIDVHNHAINQTENPADFFASTESYGKHRYEFEKWVLQNFTKVHIARLPALFGMGLKKNALYDLLNSRLLQNLNLEDSFQWYDLRWLYNDLQLMVEKNIGLLHLYSKPIQMRQIVTELFPQLLSFVKSDCLKKVTYNHSSLYIDFMKSEIQVMDSMKTFVHAYSGSKLTMHCVSNLHWNSEYDLVAKTLLQKNGIKYVELVVSKYVSWDDSELTLKMKAISDEYKTFGITIYSFQSLLYGIEGSFSLMKEAIQNRLIKVFSLAKELNVQRLVFGSPSLRKFPNTRDDVVELLKWVTKNIPQGVIFCVEPNSKQYFCEIGTNVEEVFSLITSAGIKEINNVNSNVAINFDIGNAWMENDLIPSSSKNGTIKHVQISMPQLKTVDENLLQKMLTRYHHVLHYNSVISLEVNSSILCLADDIYSTISVFRACQSSSQTQKYLIIGGGWYGCHVAQILENHQKQFDITDKSNQIMSASSIHNQNRLHLGFHYPRSFVTRQECKRGYEKFKKQYPQFTHSIENYYVISKLSFVNFDDYCDIYRKECTSFTLVPFSNLNFLEINETTVDGGNLIKNDELFIDPLLVSKYFKEKLTDKLISPDLIDEDDYSVVLDCTYGQRKHQSNLVASKNSIFELCVTLIYKLRKVVEPFALTVMDGPFFSIYPYDIENCLYTVTHVTFTPVFISEDIEKINSFVFEEHMLQNVKKDIESSVEKYLSNFCMLFEYHSFFTSIKKKITNNIGDDRSFCYLHNENSNTHTFWGGKITGMYEIDDILFPLLKL